MISANGTRWFLINASPDLRQQIEANRELWPSAHLGRRNTPIAGIVLTTADLDQVLGLLLLREFQPLTVYATGLVRRVLEANSFFRMLTRVPNQLAWVEITPGVPFSLDGVMCTPMPLSDSLPYYAREFSGDDRGEAGLGLIFNSGQARDSGQTRVAYTPSLPAITDELLAAYASCDVILVDGTFWSDAELNRTQAGTPLARSIGHIPMSGEDGTIAQLAGITRPRKLFTHINNTNPALDRSSPEATFVRESGWELGHDGWQLN
ncbi:MAG TPA: MBL fold metallo-hydrolase [Acidobacteriaceae bacterium]|nr:MBL fold metallo-hydrolase [Acidobacteriaceae bacterium]